MFWDRNLEFISKKPLGALIAFLLVVCLCISLIYILSPGKIEQCRELKPGITVTDLNNKFGEPIHEMNKDNNTWLFFNSSFFAAGPIQARVNPETYEVLELKCTEDDPSEWKVDAVK